MNFYKPSVETSGFSLAASTTELFYNNPAYNNERIQPPAPYSPISTQELYTPTTNRGAYSQHVDDRDERPLLEELGIDLKQIRHRTFAVLNPFNSEVMVGRNSMDKDLTGPLLFLIMFAFSLLIFLHKPHFGYVYGFTVLGSAIMYVLLKLMAGPQFGSNIDLCYVLSVLGYSLLPLICLSLTVALIDLTGIIFQIKRVVVILKYIVSLCFVAWASISASRYFVNALGNQKSRRLLIVYPCCLFYTVFSLLILF